MTCGIFLNGRVFRIPLPHFLISRMHFLTSDTCSFAAMVFATKIGTRLLSFSNSLSISTAPTWKPLWNYMFITLVMPTASCFAVQDGVYSAVTRFKPLETLTRNGTLFTNMTSTASVTL